MDPGFSLVVRFYGLFDDDVSVYTLNTTFLVFNTELKIFLRDKS